MRASTRQLVSYLAPSAPATRRHAEGDEPFLRPEVGFTPKWYRDALGIDFGERWHTDPAYRRETVIAMREELRRRFPGTAVGGSDRPDSPLDLLTGTYGATFVAQLYGVPAIYAEDNWPNCAKQYLTDTEVDALRPPDLDTNPAFHDLTRQVDWIAEREDRVEGFVNWQGVLNNAHRLRGEQLFPDMIGAPERCWHLFECVCATMVEAAQRLHERQRQTGVEVGFFTVSNCLVNLVSPEQYRELLLPFDMRLAEAFGCLGIHNCAWNIDPYREHYAAIPNVGYLDMGLDSDMARVRALFPDARRAAMYTPMEVRDKSLDAIEADLSRIARELGPCDVVFADIEAGTPDERVLDLVRLCEKLSDLHGGCEGNE